MFSCRGSLLLALAACASAVLRARSAGLHAAVARDADAGEVPAVAAAAAAAVSDAEAALAHADAMAATVAAALSSAGAALPRADAAAAVSDAGAAVAHADAAGAAALGTAHADASALAPRFAGSAAAAEMGIAPIIVAGAVISAIQGAMSTYKEWKQLQGNALLEAQSSDLRDISAATLRAVDALGAPLKAVSEGLAERVFYLKRDLLIDMLSALPPRPAAVLLESVRDADDADKKNNPGKRTNKCREDLLTKYPLSPAVYPLSPGSKKKGFITKAGAKMKKYLQRAFSTLPSTTKTAGLEKLPPALKPRSKSVLVSSKQLEKGHQPSKAKSTYDLKRTKLASALAMAANTDFDVIASSSAGLLGVAPDLCVLHVIAPALVLRAVELSAPADRSEHWAAALIADGALKKRESEDETEESTSRAGTTVFTAEQLAGALGTTAMPMIANAFGSKMMDAVNIRAGYDASADAPQISVSSYNMGFMSGELYQLNNLILGTANIIGQLLDILSLRTSVNVRSEEGERAIGVALGTGDAAVRHAQARACSAFLTLRATSTAWLALNYGMGGNAKAELARADFLALFFEVAADGPLASAVSTDAALLARATRSALRRATDVVYKPLKARLDSLFKKDVGRCAALDKAKWREEGTTMLNNKEYMARRARVCVTPNDIYDVQLTTAKNSGDARWGMLGYSTLTNVNSTHADPASAGGSGAAATVTRLATDMIPNLELNGDAFNAQYRKPWWKGSQKTKSSGEVVSTFGVDSKLPATIFAPATEDLSRVLLLLRCGALINALKKLDVQAAEDGARADLAAKVAAAAAAEPALPTANAEKRRKLEFFAALLAAGPITDLAVRRRPPITAGLDTATARNGRAMSPRAADASFGAVVADIAQGYTPVLFTVLKSDELPPVVTIAAPFPRRLAGDKEGEKAQPTVAPRSAVSVARSAYARLELALADVSAPSFGSLGSSTESPIKALEAANNELNSMGNLVRAAATDSLEDQVFQDMRYPSKAQRALHIVVSRTGPSRITDVTLLPFADPYTPNTGKTGGDNPNPGNLILNKKNYDAVAEIISGATKKVVELEKTERKTTQRNALDVAREKVLKYEPKGTNFRFNLPFLGKDDFDKKVADLRMEVTETRAAAEKVFQSKMKNYQAKNIGATDAIAEAAVRDDEIKSKVGVCALPWTFPNFSLWGHSCSWFLDETKKVLESVEPKKVHEMRASFQESGSYLFVNPEGTAARTVTLNSAGTLPMPAPPGCTTTDTVKMAAPVPEAPHWWQEVRAAWLTVKHVFTNEDTEDKIKEDRHLKPFGIHNFETTCFAKKGRFSTKSERLAIAESKVSGSWERVAISPYEGPLPTSWRRGDTWASVAYDNVLSLLRPFLWVRRAYDLPQMTLSPAEIYGKDILKAHRRADDCDDQLYIPHTT